MLGCLPSRTGPSPQALLRSRPSSPNSRALALRPLVTLAMHPSLPRPAASRDPLARNDKLTIAGWGLTQDDPAATSTHLMTVSASGWGSLIQYC